MTQYENIQVLMFYKPVRELAVYIQLAYHIFSAAQFR